MKINFINKATGRRTSTTFSDAEVFVLRQFANIEKVDPFHFESFIKGLLESVSKSTPVKECKKQIIDLAILKVDMETSTLCPF